MKRMGKLTLVSLNDTFPLHTSNNESLNYMRDVV